LAMRVAVAANVTPGSLGARLTGFSVDDEIAVLKLDSVAGWDCLNWRARERAVRDPQGYHKSKSSSMSPTSPRCPPSWLPTGMISNAMQRRLFWRATVLACDPDDPEITREHPCLVQVAADPMERTLEGLAADLKDAWTVASYANRFNLHLSRQANADLSASDGILSFGSGREAKPHIAVQVCVPVVCEVIGSVMPHYMCTGDFALVSLLDSDHVEKFVYNGYEEFNDNAQAFFHFCTALSSGKEVPWDLQGHVEKNSGCVVLQNPCVQRRPQIGLGDILTAGRSDPREMTASQQFDFLHPKCNDMCETFDCDRRGAYGKGFIACSC